jgi:hypothetical protein
MYETKVILKLLADSIARAESIEEAYSYVSRAASAEGMTLPSFEDCVKEIKQLKKND